MNRQLRVVGVLLESIANWSQLAKLRIILIFEVSFFNSRRSLQNVIGGRPRADSKRWSLGACAAWSQQRSVDCVLSAAVAAVVFLVSAVNLLPAGRARITGRARVAGSATYGSTASTAGRRCQQRSDSIIDVLCSVGCGRLHTGHIFNLYQRGFFQLRSIPSMRHRAI